jgi:hypothetical protein
MSDDAKQHTPRRGGLPAVQQRADALTTGVRRSLWPVLAIVLAIAAQALIQFLAVAPSDAGVFVVYSLLMLAMLPALVTFGASGMSALLTKEPLPPWLLAVFAGVITGAWVAWIAATGWLGLMFGVVLGAAVTGTALILTRPWSLLVRLPAAVVAAVVGSVVMLVVAAQLS